MQTAVAVIGRNITPRDAFLCEVGELGKEHAVGAMALTKLAPLVINAAVDGKIKRDTATAREIYGVYLGIKPEDVAKSDASKLRQLIKLGANDHGAHVADRAESFHGTIPKGKSKPLFTAMVAVARLQLRNPKKALTDNQIKEALMVIAPAKAAPKAKDPASEREAVIKSAVAMIAAGDAVVIEALKAALRDQLNTMVETSAGIREAHTAA